MEWRAGSWGGRTAVGTGCRLREVGLGDMKLCPGVSACDLHSWGPLSLKKPVSPDGSGHPEQLSRGSVGRTAAQGRVLLSLPETLTSTPAAKIGLSLPTPADCS